MSKESPPLWRSADEEFGMGDTQWIEDFSFDETGRMKGFSSER